MESKSTSFIEKYVKIIVWISAVCGSASSIFGKAMEMSSMGIGFWRLTLGLPFFAIPVLLKEREELKSLSAKQVLSAFAAGIFLFLHFYSWFSSVKMTSIGSAVVLESLHPIVIILITVFIFKEKVGARPIMGIILAILGGAMIAGLDLTGSSGGSFKGDIIAFFAGMAYGIYLAIGSQVRKTVSGNVYVFLCFLSCWICFLIGMIVSDTPFIGYSSKDWILVLGITIICQIGSHAIKNLCVGYIDSLYVSAVGVSESVFAIVLGIIFLREFPTQGQIVGCIIVMVGLLYYNYWKSKGEQKLSQQN